MCILVALVTSLLVSGPVSPRRAFYSLFRHYLRNVLCKQFKGTDKTTINTFLTRYL